MGFTVSANWGSRLELEVPLIMQTPMSRSAQILYMRDSSHDGFLKSGNK